MHSAILAASQTLQFFLKAQLDSEPTISQALNGSVLVATSNPQEIGEAQIEAVSVWLYRIVRDEDQLNAPPQRISATDFRQPPLPLRLHYLVTPVFETSVLAGPEREQRILGRILQALHDQPRLTGTLLAGSLAGTTVELLVRLEPMTLEEITRVWDALEAPYQLSVSYEVSIVDIRSERVETISPVQTLIPEVGVVAGG